MTSTQSHSKGFPKTSAGFSVIEILVTLSILGVLAAIGVARLQPQSDRVFANDLQLMIQQARFEAVKKNTPVAVVWNSTDRQFETRLTPGSLAIANVCTTGQLINTKALNDYPHLSISGDLEDGIVWLPNGSVRKCDGTLPAASFTITKSGASNDYTLTVKQSGHVAVSKTQIGTD